MNEIGLFVLNYNRREDVINNLRSIKKQTIQNFDLFVVDNASEDDSVECIKKEFGNYATIIQIKKNAGASGGFNRCLQESLDRRYKYTALADNDIIMAEN